MAPPINAPGNYRMARASKHGHVTDEIVSKLEDEVSGATGWGIDRSASLFFQKLARLCVRQSLRYPFTNRSAANTFMVMMGSARIPLNAAEWLATKGKRVAWLFDAWPCYYDDILRFTELYRLDKVFVTAKQSGIALNSAVRSPVFHWCPEPLVELGFKSMPWHDRRIDVLQFGRRYEPYHNRLVEGLHGSDMEYLFEEESGTVVFPTTPEFIDGLASTKVCVCFPQMLTHPERAGDVSTMTQRYLQCMASSCLLIGSTPDEMIELMGYDPVVQADMDDPAGQIREVLGNPEEYRPLIEKNLNEVSRHKVAARMESVLAELP